MCEVIFVLLFRLFKFELICCFRSSKRTNERICQFQNFANSRFSLSSSLSCAETFFLLILHLIFSPKNVFNKFIFFLLSIDVQTKARVSFRRRRKNTKTVAGNKHKIFTLVKYVAVTFYYQVYIWISESKIKATIANWLFPDAFRGIHSTTPKHIHQMGQRGYNS